jgi:ribosome-binding protein aMBF1 (putative translation factor)
MVARLQMRGKDHTQNVTKDKNLKRATRELRTLLERFANNMSLDIVLDAVDAIIDDARRDEGLTRMVLCC